MSTSQTIAMNLRHHLYESMPGAVHNTYPHGPARPVPVRYTDDELRENARARDVALTQWKSVDPDGHRAWHLATEAVKGGDESALRDGWSAMILEEYGLRIVDPCAYCSQCRT